MTARTAAASSTTKSGRLTTSTYTGEVWAAAGSDPQLLIAEVDLDAVDTARDSIAVLRNRTSFAQSGKAQSLG